MNAILLCAGISKRLRPTSFNNPKCLIKFGRNNLLEFWLKKLNDIGIKKILINTHYFDKKIKKFIYSNKIKDRVHITFEKQLLGTAGTLMKNINFYDNQDGLLIHSDNFMTENLKVFLQNHKRRPENCLMSMLTFSTNDPKSCGIIKSSKKNILEEFYEKPKKKVGNKANAAIYCLSKEMIKELKLQKKSYIDFSTEIIPKYKRKIFCIHTNDFFIDIGNIKNLNLVKSRNRFHTN